jgi:hypothetical protein
MKQFLQKLLFFSIWFIAISFMLQQLIFFFIRNIEIGELGVINKAMGGKINTEIIICGASRGYDAFNPEIISQITQKTCYNISLTGSRLGLQLPVLKAYLEQNKKPEAIILEVGMYSLDFDSRIYAPYKYLPYLSNKTIYSGLLEVDKYFAFQKFLPFASFYYLNTEFQKRFIKELTYKYVYKKDYLLNGFNPMSTNPSFTQDYITEFEKNNRLKYSIDKKAKEYLVKIIDLCKLKNISLIFVNTPEFYKVLPLYDNRNNINGTIKKICEMENIRYIDYSESELTFEKNYFYDFTHLNSEGAKIFSEDFAYDLVKFMDDK